MSSVKGLAVKIFVMGNCFFNSTTDEAARAATRTRTHPTLNPAVAELDIVVPASHSGSSSIINDPFLLILVVTKNEFGEDVFRVTFDDNSTSNQWAYHDSGSDFHVTELFRIPSARGLLVQILGVPPPLSPVVKWRLTVTENNGVPEQFPKFLPETIDVNPHLHTVFNMEVDTDGRAAFGFTTTQGNKYYLVPSAVDGVDYIETKETDEPENVFQTANVDNNNCESILPIHPPIITGGNTSEEREERGDIIVAVSTGEI